MVKRIRMLIAYWIIGLIVSALLFMRFVNRNDFVEYLQQSMLKCGIERTNKNMACIALFLTFIVVSLIYPIALIKILSNGSKGKY